MNSRNASSIVFLLIKCNNVSDRIGLIAADKMVIYIYCLFISSSTYANFDAE